VSAAPDPAPLLHPRSVAVVGANDRAGSYGDVIFRNLAAAGFEIADVHYERRLYGAYTCVKSG